MSDAPSARALRVGPGRLAADHGWSAVITLLLVVVGCASTEPKTMTWQHHYNPADYAPYQAPGKTMLTGHAAAKSRLGHDIIAVDDTVYLFPATPYADEWWERSLIQGYYLPSPDPRTRAFLRSTDTDEDGDFVFGPLPPGEYYLVCTVNCSEDQPGSTWDWQSHTTVPRRDVVNLGKKVRLAATDTVHVVLEPISHTTVLVDPPPAR